MNKQNRESQNRAKRNGTKGFKVIKMDDDIFKLRRNVMEVLYELKRVVEVERQVIRIVESDGTESHDGWHNICGYAGLNDNYIHITKKWADRMDYLYELVAHELVHSATGFMHDSKCPLMRPALGDKPLSKEAVNKALLKYF